MQKVDAASFFTSFQTTCEIMCLPLSPVTILERKLGFHYCFHKCVCRYLDIDQP